jgi:diguanylate cyclase (GGDEF)-like protein/PAS domain S-box-containing protein
MIEPRRVEEARFAARERAEVTLNSIGDAVLSTNIDGRVTYLNLAAEAMTGWSRDAAAGRPLDDVFHIIDGATREPSRNPLNLAMELNKSVGLTENCVLVRRDGHESAIEDSAAPIHDKDGRLTGAVIVFRDVGAALETSRQMSRLAQHDVLTGLPNRLLLHDRLTEAIALGHRHNKPLAVCFLDVDGFKGINDSVGHAAADEVLRSIAFRLTDALRQSDAVSRIGGDEFVILLSEIAHAEDTALVAKKLLQAIAGPHHVESQDIRVTASLGVSLYPDHGQDADTLITHADAAMYHAKRAGPGQYRLFDVGMQALAVERQSLESGLSVALGRHELDAYYQPQIDLTSGDIIGVEVLARWRHPQRGLLPAAAFIPVAEACGLMVSIGQWAIREACRQARAWQDARLRSMLVAVNVFGVEFWRRHFLDDVQAILEDTGLEAGCLELEITEDTLIQDVPSAVVALHALKELGVHVVVDHFGTGHLSLSDLQQFPVDVLKVDPSVVQGIAADVTDAPVLTAILGFGTNLNRRVMVAGVETEGQLAFLQAQHCSEAQGHLFSPPIGANQLKELLGNWPGLVKDGGEPSGRLEGTRSV